MTLTGDFGGQTTTSGNGNFSFNKIAGGYTCTVTPSPTLPPATWTKNVNSDYNSVGVLSGVGTNITVTDPNATTNVLNTTTFRASGEIRSVNYGNGRRLTMGSNANRQQPVSMKADRFVFVRPIERSA